MKMKRSSFFIIYQDGTRHYVVGLISKNFGIQKGGGVITHLGTGGIVKDMYRHSKAKNMVKCLEAQPCDWSKMTKLNSYEYKQQV